MLPRAACNQKDHMAIDEPVSDTSRAIQHDPDQTWPASVVLQVTWLVDGRYRTSSMVIEGDAFFGRGRYGAPMHGHTLIAHIENMRRVGPPPAPKQGLQNAKGKTIPKGKRRAQGRR